MNRIAAMVFAAGWCLIGASMCAQERTPAPSGTGARAVATVDLFGYSGWDGDDPDTATLRQRVAQRVGLMVQPGQAAAFRRKVQGDVVAVTGQPATDVSLVSCDAHGGLAVFVGVQGKDAQPLGQRATPTGPDTLPPEAFSFYEDSQKAASEASTRGAAQEDDSQGYALAADPATRTAEERMRAFAVGHEDMIVRVLRRSGNVQQRRAAASLLGYAQRSTAQIRDLLDALADDDDGVRNNAAQALAVLAMGAPLPHVNPEPLIGLLYSGIWTDRNKAATLLLALTGGHDPKLLKVLREQALPPLIEGARWQSKLQEEPFARLLARVVGLADERAESLIHDGKADEIVQQAVALRGAGAKR